MVEGGGVYVNAVATGGVLGGLAGDAGSEEVGGSDAGSGGVGSSDAGSGKAGVVGGGVFVVVVGVHLADFDFVFDVDWPLFSRLLANGPFFLMSLRDQ